MSKKVLIIDDRPEIADVLQAVSRIEGLIAEVAFDGVSGLKKIPHFKPDLILMDVMMPKLNGLKLCKMIKESDAYKHIPVVLLSARNSNEDIDLAFEVGADDYVVKPFALDRILSVFDRFNCRKQKEPALVS